MPKSTNQKRKLLCLMQILLEQTDEDHFLPLARLTELLAQQGIEAERKSLYDDMEQLRQFGVDVEFVKGSGYHVPNRTFQLAELKLLVDQKAGKPHQRASGQAAAASGICGGPD